MHGPIRYGVSGFWIHNVPLPLLAANDYILIISGALVPPQQKTVWIALSAMPSIRESCQDRVIWQMPERSLGEEAS